MEKVFILTYTQINAETSRPIDAGMWGIFTTPQKAVVKLRRLAALIKHSSYLFNVTEWKVDRTGCKSQSTWVITPTDFYQMEI